MSHLPIHSSNHRLGVGRGGITKPIYYKQQHNETWVTLSHLLSLSTPAPTRAGGFILLGPDKVGNLVVVLDHKRGGPQMF